MIKPSTTFYEDPIHEKTWLNQVPHFYEDPIHEKNMIKPSTIFYEDPIHEKNMIKPSTTFFMKIPYMKETWLNQVSYLYEDPIHEKNMIKPSFLYLRIILTFLHVSCTLTCFSCQASPPQSCRSWQQHELQPHQHPPPSSWESYWLLFQYMSQVLLQVTVSHWTCSLFSLYLSFSSNYHTQICSKVITIRLKE